jgi:hypothetical protein
MPEEKGHTKLLPPIVAIRIAWAMTGSFSSDSESHNSAVLAEKRLKDIYEESQNKEDSLSAEQLAQKEKEKEYVGNAYSLIQANMRTLDTIYKGRELNFKENEELRSVYLDSIKNNLEFGKKAQDFFKSLPTMTITTAAGTVSVSQVFQGLPGWSLALVGLGAAGIGYVINLWIVRIMRKEKQRQYIEQDYERNLYYEQYINRVLVALISLYYDLDRIHKRVFNNTYESMTEIESKEQFEDSIKAVVEDVLKGAGPTMCENVYDHMKQGIITPDLWVLCEVGGERAKKQCHFWKKPVGN